MGRNRSLFTSCLLFLSSAACAQGLSASANDFINSLNPDLKNEVEFSLESEERYNMNFVPRVRKGPTFHDFNASQKKAALNLLALSLSKTGYNKTTQIMELEKILNAREGNWKLSDGNPGRDPLNYHFCIFGKPSSNSVWGWRFEGHHVSLNFTIQNERIVASTPSFFGSNPAIVTEGADRGKQILKLEMDLGFKLINSLDQEQLKVARISDSAPHEIITGNDREVSSLDPKGILYSALNAEQRKTLIDLLKVYVNNYELGFASTLMAKIEKAGLENLSFAWAGSVTPGSGQYYRIQGPMLLIEYDNVQNNANHVHTVVRDLTNDFAEDVLKEHYQKEH